MIEGTGVFDALMVPGMRVLYKVNTPTRETKSLLAGMGLGWLPKATIVGVSHVIRRCEGQALP